jgi:hypothetical protein
LSDLEAEAIVLRFGRRAVEIAPCRKGDRLEVDTVWLGPVGRGKEVRTNFRFINRRTGQQFVLVESHLFWHPVLNRSPEGLQKRISRLLQIPIDRVRKVLLEIGLIRETGALNPNG